MPLKDRIRRRIKPRTWQQWKNFISYIGWEDCLGGCIIFLGVLGSIPGPIPYINWFTEFYRGMSSELIGIGITVLIIDNANEMMKRREEKKRLILQMGSPDNAFAREAVRQLRVRGWLTDGSLKNAILLKANLRGAILRGVILRGAILVEADLRGADLIEANLDEAILVKADLSGADMRGADLVEADLIGAILREADLRGADLIGAYLSWADLSGAFLYKADLNGARITDEQLVSVKFLWRANMIDSSKYDGRYNLEGDLTFAEQTKININDPEAMAQWYGISLEEYLAGQEWAKENLEDLQERAKQLWNQDDE